MLSLHGIYENGKITLMYPSSRQLPEDSEVLVVFVEDTARKGSETTIDGDSKEDNEEYYKSIREFERVEAQGTISIIDQNARYTFALNDYSQGGLSFISDKEFHIGQIVSSGISDPANPDMVLMELEMEVRGIFSVETTETVRENEQHFKIGCQFVDPVDEDLWHGLLQYLD
ncbi:MAG: PilZ domain-containing protein [Proteobacteria bacterium]|nr:PilZ domain-containing protein [Pseudomonadota bacterium]